MEDPEFTPDVDAMHRRMMQADIRAGLRRSRIESFPALLAHELVHAHDRLIRDRLGENGGREVDRAGFHGVTEPLDPLALPIVRLELLSANRRILCLAPRSTSATSANGVGPPNE